MSERVRSRLRRPDHPLAAGNDGRVLRSRLTLFDSLDGIDAPCHWCGCELHWRVQKASGDIRADDLLVDHLDEDWRNDDLSNLVPACRGCNANRSRLKRDRQCEWCGETFTPRRPESRFCSVSCSARRQWADGNGWSCKP